MMIKFIIFDIGGIIIPEKEDFIIKEIARYLNFDVSKHQYKYKKIIDYARRKLTTGKLKIIDLFKKILKISRKKDVKAEELLNLFIKLYKKHCTKLNQGVLDLIKKLKKNYNVIGLTNTEMEIAKINKANGVFDIFKKCYISTEMKMMKPDRQIFETVLNDLNAKPEETVFIDDREENVNAAKKLMINTILYSNVWQLKKKLVELGIQ